MKQNRRTCQDIDLNNCRVLDEVLWKDDRLWILQSMITWLIREAHDLSINDHSDMNRTLNLLRWSYCWSKMRTIIKRYIQNYYVCRRSKASRDQINELLKSLLIFEQWWQNISLDFIIDLSESDDNNAILTVIDRLSKKRHYISCWSDDEEIFAEQTVKLLLTWIFRTHELSRSIVFDRDSQFISIVWKSLCLRLESRWNYSQTIIRRQMIKQKERIRMWNDIYEAIARICKMIDSPDYLWLNSSITMLFHRQLNSRRSFWIRTFTLIWASIRTQSNMRSFKLESKQAKQRIYSNTWNDH